MSVGVVDLLTVNDRPGRHPASYYAATADALDPLPALDGDARADVCVVGAGYTGLSAALHLAERGYDVLVLEAQRVGWGASGRNGGQVGSGQRRDQRTLEKMVGEADARLLWGLAVEAVELVKALVETHRIACDLRPGVMHVDHRAGHVAQTRADVDHLRRAYGYEAVRFVPAGEVAEMLGTDAFFGGALDMDAVHLHPLDYALGLARAALGAGVRIVERTRATGIAPGDLARVTTGTGTVGARYVVLACDGYLGRLDGRVAARVMPINSFMVASEKLGETVATKINRDNVAVADSRFVTSYWRLSADRRLLFGGAESYGYRFPADIAGLVRPRIEAIYPGLRGLRYDYAWGGTMGITMNRMPHFARAAPNVFSASGYSGHGVGMATLAGKLLAEAVAGTAERFDVMARVPSPPFPGGIRLRRPLLALAMAWFALRDRL